MLDVVVREELRRDDQGGVARRAGEAGRVLHHLEIRIGVAQRAVDHHHHAHEAGLGNGEVVARIVGQTQRVALVNEGEPVVGDDVDDVLGPRGCRKQEAGAEDGKAVGCRHGS